MIWSESPRDAEDVEAFVFERLKCVVHRREFADARSTPRSPEIDQRDFTGEKFIGEFFLSAVEVPEMEFRASAQDLSAAHGAWQRREASARQRVGVA